MNEHEKISLLKSYAFQLLSTRSYNLDTFSEICLTLYALDLYGYNVQELLREFRLLLENNMNAWINFSMDLVRVNPDAVSAIFLLSLKYDKEFAEKLRYIADDVAGFQMPDGRVIIGDHLGLTRLLINMLGSGHKVTIKALDYIVTNMIPSAESIPYIIEIVYTLSYTHDLALKFRKILKDTINKVLQAQLDNGSWNNNVTLTGMATHFLMMLDQKVYKDKIENAIKWLKEQINIQGLKINEIREIMIRTKELEIPPIEISFPILIIDEEETELVEELIHKISKSILLINTPPSYIAQYIKNIIVGKQLILRLLIGPQSDKQMVDELSKIGFITSETDTIMRAIIIDDEIVIFHTYVQNHDAFLALKQKGLEEMLWSHLKK